MKLVSERSLVDPGNHGARSPLFKTLDTDFFEQGLRLRSIHVDGDTRITAVWRPGSGAQFWEAGLSFSKLKDKTKEHGENGLRLHLIARSGADDDRYMGVWRPGPAPWFWHVGLTWDQFELITQQMFDLGFHLTYMPLWGNNGIWDQKSGFQEVLVTTNKTKFKNVDTAHFDAGRRMRTSTSAGRLSGTPPSMDSPPI